MVQPKTASETRLCFHIIESNHNSSSASPRSTLSKLSMASVFSSVASSNGGVYPIRKRGDVSTGNACAEPIKLRMNVCVEPIETKGQACAQPAEDISSIWPSCAAWMSERKWAVSRQQPCCAFAWWFRHNLASNRHGHTAGKAPAWTHQARR